MSRLKICHIQVLPILSGVQRAMLAFFEAMPADRFEIVVICQAVGPLTGELDRRGIRHLELPELDRPIDPRKDLRAFLELWRIFRRERFDVVHTHSSKPGILGRLAARAARVPLVIHHNHGFSWTKESTTGVRLAYQLIERFAAHFCDLMIFVADETRHYAARRGIVPLEKSMLVYNGVDLERLHPVDETERRRLRARYGVPEEAFVVTFVGRLWEQKNPLLLVPIAREVRRMAPDLDLCFVVAGEGHLREPLEAAIREAGLSDRFIFLGWLEDTTSVYQLTDVLLSTSRFEGLPLVLTEGMATGTPAICSDIPGSREAISSEVGYREPIEAPARFAARITTLARDPALLATMRRNARARAEKLFDRTVNSRRIPEIYERLLAKQRLEPDMEPSRA